MELWKADPKLQGEPLLISGVVYRRFRSEPRGQFPSLEELWIRTDDDGLAVVTNLAPPKDSGPGNDRTSPGSAVRLVSYFLRKIQYEAEDEPRIAPWLVSNRFESESEAGSAPHTAARDDQRVFLIILAVIVAVTALRFMLLWSDRSRRRADERRNAVRQRSLMERSRPDDPNEAGEASR
jgi:hypothetical protein